MELLTLLKHKHNNNIIRTPIKPIINPLTAKLFNLNFHPLDVVSR